VVQSQTLRARNVGIRAARNKWIALIDADDLWETDKLELQWRASKLCPEAAIAIDDSTKDGKNLIFYRGRTRE
jgi:glycosyltransferase involved in cell wall biosynthesis